jgi:hypothetical protein
VAASAHVRQSDVPTWDGLQSACVRPHAVGVAQHDAAHRPDKRISGHMIAAAMMTSIATIIPIRMPIRTVR